MTLRLNISGCIEAECDGAEAAAWVRFSRRTGVPVRVVSSRGVEVDTAEGERLLDGVLKETGAICAESMKAGAR